jgi:hypothetical protein
MTSCEATLIMLKLNKVISIQDVSLMSRSDHNWWVWRVYIEEKELLSLPEHRNSPAFIDKVCVSHFCVNSRWLLFVFLITCLPSYYINYILCFDVKRHFQQYFSYIVADSFIGGRNRSTRRKQPTCRKTLTIFITYCCIECTSPWAGFELTTLVVIRTDCIGSYKSNYHAISRLNIFCFTYNPFHSS